MTVGVVSPWCRPSGLGECLLHLLSSSRPRVRKSTEESPQGYIPRSGPLYPIHRIALVPTFATMTKRPTPGSALVSTQFLQQANPEYPSGLEVSNLYEKSGFIFGRDSRCSMTLQHLARRGLAHRRFKRSSSENPMLQSLRLAVVCQGQICPDTVGKRYETACR